MRAYRAPMTWRPAGAPFPVPDTFAPGTGTCGGPDRREPKAALPAGRSRFAARAPEGSPPCRFATCSVRVYWLNCLEAVCLFSETGGRLLSMAPGGRNARASGWDFLRRFYFLPKPLAVRPRTRRVLDIRRPSVPLFERRMGKGRRSLLRGAWGEKFQTGNTSC